MEKAHYRAEWTLIKFRDPDGKIAALLRAGASAGRVAELASERLICVERVQGNLLLYEGIQYFEDVIAGIEGSPVLWDSANARVGAGNSDAAADPAQTDLLGTKAYAAMDATYPKRSGQKLSWRGSFPDGEAEFAWEEFCVDNGSASGKTLNRKTASKGTKGPGEAWSLELGVTWS